MKPCPHCGAMLTAALVDDIRDPNNDEQSCPRRPKFKSREIKADYLDPRKRLLGYALLGQLAGN
jgi:hypothetical protein